MVGHFSGDVRASRSKGFVCLPFLVHIKHGLVVIFESILHHGGTLGKLFYLDSPSDVQCVLSHIRDSCLLSWFSCYSHCQFGLFGMVRLNLGGLGHH